MVNMEFVLKCPKCLSTDLSTEFPNIELQDNSIIICENCKSRISYKSILSYNYDSIIDKIEDNAIDEATQIINKITNKYKKWG